MNTRGMSLIEVLVASSIMATGVLCVLTLQATALGTGIVSQHRQRASLLLMELAELVHISPKDFRDIDPASLFAADVVFPVCVVGSVCAPDTFVRNELSAWMASVRENLPDALIDIRREFPGGQPIWTVKLGWHGSQEFSRNSLQTELQLW